MNPAVLGCNQADYAVLAIIGLSAVFGLIRGLVREVISLLVWGVAVWLALQYNHALAGQLEQFLPVPAVRLAVAFAVIVLAVLIAGSLVTMLIVKLVATVGLGGTDRMAGLLFGVARGVLIVAALVVMAGVTPLPADPWWKQSQLIPPFQQLAVWLRTQIPNGLASQVKFPELTLKR